MIRPFRFWCHKVLPLVYDDSLSYYEVLCKFVKVINDIASELELAEDKVSEVEASIETLREYVDTYFANLDVQEAIDAKLDEMADNGDLDNILNAYFRSVPLAEQCDAMIYGQMKDEEFISAGYYTQGFEIYDDANGNTYAVACKSTDGSTNGYLHVMTLTVDNDGRLNSTGSTKVPITNIGHGNSLTYCDADNCLYIACGGGSNPVLRFLKVDASTFEVLGEFTNSDMPNIQRFASICWDNVNECFYIFDSGRIYKYNQALDTIIAQTNSSATLALNGQDITGQSATTDGTYIFAIKQVDGVNICNIYHCSNLQYYRTQVMSVRGEVENACFYAGNYYFLTNSSYVGLVYIGFPYSTNALGAWSEYNYIRSFYYSNVVTETSFYSDRGYSGFRVDGTSAYPFGRYLNLMNYIKDKDYADIIDIYIKGDEDTGINIKKGENVRYYGVDGASVPFIYVRNVQSLYVYDLTVTNANTARNECISILHCPYVYLNNITVSNLLSVPRVIGNICSNVFVRECDFSDALYSGYLIYSNQGGQTILDSDSDYGDTPIVYANSNTKIPSAASPYQPSFAYMHNAYDVCNISAPTNFDMSGVRRSGWYKVTGSGATSVNCPEALATGAYGFTCVNLASTDKGNTDGLILCLYEIVANDGTYYKAILHGATLDWYDITGTQVGTFTVDR